MHDTRPCKTGQKILSLFQRLHLLKLLFKSPLLSEKTHLLSRYDTSNPICCRNPLTNEVIVVEVEFFIIKAEEVAQESPEIPINFELSVCTEAANVSYSGVFIGTDYNYAFSAEFRKIFEENAVDKEQYARDLNLRN